MPSNGETTHGILEAVGGGPMAARAPAAAATLGLPHVADLAAP
jgi:hypothetical protein